MVELGLGCIGIGRRWGVNETAVPSETEVNSFLNFALAKGIAFFDTAPAYGFSEERLGLWLEQLSPEQRKSLTIATKFGEFWNGQSYRDYSLRALKNSLDRSLDLLGPVDIIQLHGANSQNINDPEVLTALEYARSLGITQIGASISDPAALDIAVEMDEYNVIQIPHNRLKPHNIDLIRQATKKGKLIIINRPLRWER